MKQQQLSLDNYEQGKFWSDGAFNSFRIRKKIKNLDANGIALRVLPNSMKVS